MEERYALEFRTTPGSASFQLALDGIRAISPSTLSRLEGGAPRFALHSITDWKTGTH